MLGLFGTDLNLYWSLSMALTENSFCSAEGKTLSATAQGTLLITLPTRLI